MRYVTLAALFIVLAVMTTTDAQEKKKLKGSLPPGWKKLDLSAEQTVKIYKIRADYKVKIMDLQDKIMALKTDEKTELVKLLTTAQKTMLRKLVIGDEQEKKAPPDKSEK